jgi:hypothetical protein
MFNYPSSSTAVVPRRGAHVLERVAELVGKAIVVLVGWAMVVILSALAHACSVCAACLGVAARSARAAAPAVLGLGLLAQVLWLGVIAWEVVELVL